MIELLIFLTVCFVAYSNGANDNFKGVASLLGSRTASYKTALGWATATTLLGSLGSFFLATALLSKFSGKGIVPNELTGTHDFLLAVAFGAGVTVIIATLTGFPISTTHSLTGAILGAGLSAVGSGVNFAALQTGFLLPLLVSPLLAVGVGSAIYFVATLLRQRTGFSKETCVCVGSSLVPLIKIDGSAAILQNGEYVSLSVDDKANCIERYDGNFLGFSLQRVVDAGHFISAGVVSFARGLNDTPKIVALLLTAEVVNLSYGWLCVATVMAAGGVLNARKVAETMSFRITSMNSGQAFSANLATGVLVTIASLLGSPVSTTHVSVGSLFGIGVITGQANWRVVSGILLSWVITMPLSAVFSGTTYWLLRS
ncbi:MAG: anion permease [Pyrinomonadaceae bacterium]